MGELPADETGPEVGVGGGGGGVLTGTVEMETGVEVLVRDTLTS